MVIPPENATCYDAIENSPDHKWKQGLSPAELQQIQQFYR